MISVEIEQIVEGALATLPGRISGNEANQMIADILGSLMVTERSAIVGYLKRIMSFRLQDQDRTEKDAVNEARIWLALDVTESLRLLELLPDIESLSHDIHDGLVFMPVHQSMVCGYLKRMANK